MESRVKPSKLKRALKRWEFWVGVVSIALSLGVSTLIVLNWEFVKALEGYGYAGGFLISALGGATIITS